MKQFLLLACLAFCSLGLTAQTVFVDADATGGNTGTSWADAYTDLNAALNAAPAGSSVWVAAGTYTTPDTASFFINKELTLLGGFAGTEGSADEADPATNLTILSGDVDGNDGAAYDSLAAADNNRVLFITDTSTVASQYTVTVDGLTITNGAVNIDIADEDPSIIPFSGGGILSLARLDISRVTFSRNRANFGSDLALVTLTAGGTVVDDVTLSDTYVDGNRSIYLNGADDVTIQNCDFNGGDDSRTSGIIQAAFTSGLTVQDCDFSNLATQFSGAGIRTDNSDDVTVRNCDFDNLSASTGGAMYHINADNFEVAERTEDDFVFDNISITDCITAANRGGAFTSFNTSFKLLNSTLEDNTSGDIGGAIYQVGIDGREYFQVIENSTISNNIDAAAGGGICLLIIDVADIEGTPSLTGRYVNSEFEDNVSANGTGQGGFAYLQGQNEMVIRDCVFNGNVAQTGSAVITRSGDNRLDVFNTIWEENGSNNTSAQGGALVGYMEDDAPGIFIDGSTFVNNAITNIGGSFSAGGAILVLGGDTKGVPLQITNSRFENNAAGDGRTGGAIFSFGGMDIDVRDTDFLGNTAGGDGGAFNIQRNTVSRDTSAAGDITVTLGPLNVDFESTKFINSSSGTQGGAVATSRSAANFTNCVFVGNTVGAEGNSGGAVIFNGNSPVTDETGAAVLNDAGLPEEIGSLELEGRFIHCTFAGNVKGNGDFAVGDALAFFQPNNSNSTETNSMTITLLNNAFLSDSGDPSIEAEPGVENPAEGLVGIGNLEIISLGGNFFNSENGPFVDDEIGTNADDVTDDSVEEFEDFFIDLLDNNGEGVDVDLDISDFENNPLVNNGVQNALVPEQDIRDNPRGDRPDIGAYEADQGSVSVAEPIENSGLDVSFFPNPTADFLNIRNDDATISSFDVLVTDVAGRVITAKSFSGTNSVLDLTNVATGVYNLQLTVNGTVYSKQVVKQ